MLKQLNFRVMSEFLSIHINSKRNIYDFFKYLMDNKESYISECNIGNISCCKGRTQQIFLTNIIRKYTSVIDIHSEFGGNNNFHFSFYSHSFSNRCQIKHLLAFLYFIEGYYYGCIANQYPFTNTRVNPVYNFDVFNVVLMLNPSTYKLFEKPLKNTITKQHFKFYGIEFPEKTLAKNGKTLNLKQFQNRPVTNELIEELKDYVTKVIKDNRKNETE